MIALYICRGRPPSSVQSYCVWGCVPGENAEIGAASLLHYYTIREESPLSCVVCNRQQQDVLSRTSNMSNLDYALADHYPARLTACPTN